MDLTNHELSLGGPRLGGWGSDVESVLLNFGCSFFFYLYTRIQPTVDGATRCPFFLYYRIIMRVRLNIFAGEREREKRDRDKQFENTL